MFQSAFKHANGTFYSWLDEIYAIISQSVTIAYDAGQHTVMGLDISCEWGCSVGNCVYSLDRLVKCTILMNSN